MMDGLLDGAEPVRRQRRGGPLIWIAALFVVAVLIAMFATRFGDDPRVVPSPLIDQPVAPIALDYLDRPGALALDGLEGQIVVVNFWASWCVPCRAEHGYLTAANDAYRDRGVTFVGVVHQDSPQAASAFLDELGWGDGYLYVVDPDSRAAIEFGVFGVPETFFIDRDGIITGKIVGPLTAESLNGTLQKMLGEA